VLAYISVTSVVAIDPALLLLDLNWPLFRLSGMATVVVVRGSTCTISSQVCTMALIKEVFPAPVEVSLSHIITPSNVPVSPATKILSRPRCFPRSVNGRLLGILMLGITSCGALPLSIIVDSISLPSSPLDAMAWLATSSKNDPASEFRREPALLISEGGAGDPRDKGVNGRDMVVWDARRAWNGEALPLTSVEGTSVRSSSSSFETRAEFLFLCLRVPGLGS
jgi:hypothetical protein